ncbi:hypothetical protein VF14_33910 [Nostoc linckia z18]|jgi:hypothetical protein|uniref:Uncharacterized protein n=3 Tax=Nostoc TaxID=1177 RepID=A0A9Q5Z5G7_NOSLI|nr:MULTISPECIES: hypothetical protein [Nostoc]MBL1198663.1 hypothetical protein [Nostoc sp. GBBB01]MDZ8013912.1 hypothetical protein [Nostoc sp. ZfuVER08]PHK32040.1 hypothetical protein VF12_27225 [Nostoc linckia z15]PHK46835.1 hypothetical protein VF13_08345 [Nostoc linckia z16]MBD2612208.1 hypothetical protein [Nostoc punctiforme FACHB-252]
MKIWSTIAVLASSWLIFGVISSKPINAISVVGQNATSFPTPSSLKKITVSNAEFGLKRVDTKGNVTIFQTTTVPLQEGNVYGWRMKLKNYQGEVKWREVLRLPKPPQTWGTDNGENFSISADGTTSITRRTQPATDGVIENFWTIAPGDPLGKYKIEVYIDDRLINTFEFEVIPVKRI